MIINEVQLLLIYGHLTKQTLDLLSFNISYTMNQSLLNSSANRHTRKRNSHQSIKASFNLKHPKKSLPQVSIDLNPHQKKAKLAIQTRNSKAEEVFQQKQFCREPSKVGKSCKKKDQLVLNYLYNTQHMRSNGQNKNILNEYRNEIELLKLENQRLKQENQHLQKNEQYLSRRLGELKSQKNKTQSQLKQYANSLEVKLQKYSLKIKELFQELIRTKKSRLTEEDEKFYDKTTNSGLSNNQFHRHKQTRQPYTYRLKQHNVQGSRWKRMTSPSSHDRQKINWAEEQMDNIIQFEKRGEEAYYKLEKGLQGNYHSDYQ